MNTHMQRALRVVVVLAALLSIATPAYAYLDPGTGSMILSAVIGVAAAVGLALKMFWYRVLSVFRGGRREPRPGTEGRPAADQ